ncbi:MAG: hypothetical protein ACLUSP_07900 [Christensenellales bacterium]
MPPRPKTKRKKRFESIPKKRRLVESGRQIDWKVVPPANTDLAAIKEKCDFATRDVLDLYENAIALSDDEIAEMHAKR